MLKPGKKHEGLAGRLFLSSALVAVSLAYGWWQRHNAAGPSLAIIPRPMPPAPIAFLPAPKTLAATAPAVPTAPVTTAIPDTAAPGRPRATLIPARIAPRAPKSTSIARAVPHDPPSAVESAWPALQPDDKFPASPPSAPLTSQAALAMDLPTQDASPPLPRVTGTPAPGATPTIPPGTHLEDGDYLSDKHQFEWGDLRVKISIAGGQITAVQILQYPDHRSQSLYLSQMAGPLLESEVIKSQKSQVDAVSSATDTSYAFQDAIANAIMKATRG
jgi:uncharacterized protein with FMN-binding domain